MTKSTTLRAGLPPALLALALASTTPWLPAQTNGTWTNYAVAANIDANWTLNTNWLDGLVASGTDAVATFNGDLANQLQFKSGAATIGHITLTDTGGGTDRSLRFDAGFAITFDTTAGTPSITVSNYSGDIPIHFNGATVLGSDGLTLNVANATNTPSRFSTTNWTGFAGPLTLASGRYQTEGANVLPPNNEVAFGSGVQVRVLFNNTRNQTVRGFSGGDATTFVGTNDNASGDGVVTLGASSVASDSYTFSGSLGGDAFATGAGQENSRFGVNKTGASTQRFTGANSYLGPTNVNGGTLLVHGTHVADSSLSGNLAAVASRGHYNVNTGATLGGTGTIKPYNTTGATVMVDLKAGGTLAPGDGGTGTLTFDNSASNASVLNFSTGALLALDLGAGLTSDTIAIVAASIAVSEVFFNSTVANFTDLTLGALAPGSYLLFDGDAATQYAGLTLGDAYLGLNSLSGSLLSSGLTVGTGLEGYTSATLWQSGSDIYLDLVAVPEPATVGFLVGLSALGFVAWRRRSPAAKR